MMRQWPVWTNHCFRFHLNASSILPRLQIFLRGTLRAQIHPCCVSDPPRLWMGSSATFRFSGREPFVNFTAVAAPGLCFLGSLGRHSKCCLHFVRPLEATKETDWSQITVRSHIMAAVFTQTNGGQTLKQGGEWKRLKTKSPVPV